MSKSLSTRNASMNKARYCARLANCHMLRSLCSVVGSSTGASVSISSLARFLATMAGKRAVRRRVEGEQSTRPTRRGGTDRIGC